MPSYTNSQQPKSIIRSNKTLRKRFKRKPSSFFSQLPFGGYDGLQGIRDLRKRVSKIADFVNSEYHFRITNITTNAVSYSGISPILLNAISEGTGEDERNGLSIKMQNLTLNYHIGATSESIIRVIVYMDKSNTVTTIGKLLTNTGDSTAPQSFYNQAYRFQKRVLYDRTHVMTVGGGLHQNVNANIKLNMHANYIDNGPNISSTALYMQMVSDQAPSSPVGLVGYSRVSFSDN